MPADDQKVLFVLLRDLTLKLQFFSVIPDVCYRKSMLVFHGRYVKDTDGSPPKTCGNDKERVMPDVCCRASLFNSLS